MSNFNFERFYDELETDHKKEFPFWLWFIHELNYLIGIIISSIVLGVLLYFFALIAMGVFSNFMQEKYPDQTVKMFCEQSCPK